MAKMGTIKTMIDIIQLRLGAKDFGEVWEITERIMWTITGETFRNCEESLNKNGRNLTIQCIAVSV